VASPADAHAGPAPPVTRPTAPITPRVLLNLSSIPIPSLSVGIRPGRPRRARGVCKTLILVPTAILQPDPSFHLHAVAVDALLSSALLGAVLSCPALPCPALPCPALPVPLHESAVGPGPAPASAATATATATTTATMALSPRRPLAKSIRSTCRAVARDGWVSDRRKMHCPALSRIESHMNKGSLTQLMQTR
jgi:hypothetical protein